jgi:serine/threonine protein kinase/TolA-binding protein
MECGNCGTPLSNDTHFCSRCGAPTQLYGDFKDEIARPISGETGPIIAAGTLLDARYRVVKKLGSGGMGSVYEAVEEALGRPVAVKILSPSLAVLPEYVNRFELEARATASLDHPNIVPVFGVGRYGPLPFLVMKKLSGATLAQVLQQVGKLHPRVALEYFRQAAAGLDYVHSRGLLHRDIKAGNLFIGSDGHVTLLDFGVIRELNRNSRETRPGALMGTPHYTAPEIALGKGNVDYRADLYALGVVLYELLTGSYPFEANNEMALLLAHAQEPPMDPCALEPSLSKSMAAVLLRALAKRPEDRFDSGAELVNALETAIAGSAEVTQPSYATPSTPGAPRAPVPRSMPASARPSSAAPLEAPVFDASAGTSAVSVQSPAGMVMIPTGLAPNTPRPATPASRAAPVLTAGPGALANANPARPPGVSGAASNSNSVSTAPVFQSSTAPTIPAAPGADSNKPGDEGPIFGSAGTPTFGGGATTNKADPLPAAPNPFNGIGGTGANGGSGFQEFSRQYGEGLGAGTPRWIYGLCGVAGLGLLWALGHMLFASNDKPIQEDPNLVYHPPPPKTLTGPLTPSSPTAPTAPTASSELEAATSATAPTEPTAPTASSDSTAPTAPTAQTAQTGPVALPDGLNPDALFARAEKSFEHGETAAALSDLDALRQVDGFGAQQPASLMRAQALFRLKRYTEAMLAYQEYSDRFTFDAEGVGEALVKRAEASAALSFHRQAVELFSEYLKTHANARLTTEALVKRATSELKINNNDEADADLQVAEKRPDAVMWQDDITSLQAQVDQIRAASEPSKEKGKDKGKPKGKGKGHGP